MKICTLILPRRQGTLTLAKKKFKVGANLYNGYGGKLEEEDRGNIEVAAVREFNQEAHTAKAEVKDLEKVAIIDFHKAGTHIFECHVYFLNDWEGEISESTEMGPPQEFTFDALPYAEMMEADKRWIPLVLEGKLIRGTCYYTEGNKEVEKFEYEIQRTL